MNPTTSTGRRLSATFMALVLICAVLISGQVPESLPEPERALASTVDPWGAAFSDLLRQYARRFEKDPKARFALGATHDLVKVWPNKYWFRGESVLSSTEPTGLRLRAETLWAAAGETQGFQVVVLPRQSALEATYSIEVNLRGDPAASVTTYRQYFVKTARPGYPRFPVERWPDPLARGDQVRVRGADCGLFWIDVRVPADSKRLHIEAEVRVSDGSESAHLVVPIKVVPGLHLDPKTFPLVAWFRDGYGSKRLSARQRKGMWALALEHNIQPLDALRGQFHAVGPQAFDEFHAFLHQRGQRLFEIDRPNPDSSEFDAVYQHVKKAGWLDQVLVYSNQDEPSAETFRRANVPFYREVQSKYPGLKVFLASQGHDRMEEGCDIWMTDLSTVGYDPVRMRTLKEPVLWHYYCHLPIRVELRAPITMAPNMVVDCEALQHRLALWMSHYYGAKGVFIWAGFSAGGLADDFWRTLELERQTGRYPYGGVHNGNNFLVYPPQTEDGPVLPSLRLKVLRDAMEDLALFRVAEDALAEGRIQGKRAAILRSLLNPTPDVFVHPHHWDRLPETLLSRRVAILKALSEISLVRGNEHGGRKGGSARK